MLPRVAIVLFGACVGLVLTGCSRGATSPGALAPDKGGGSAAKPAPVSSLVTPPQDAQIVLSPDIPHDVSGSGNDLASLQNDFDVYSWNTFISLNWPPGQNGSGDPNQTIGQHGDNPTVWEGWIESSDIFLPGGTTPQNPPPRQIPAICPQAPASARFLSQIAKVPNEVLEESTEPFDTGPLIDQNGAYARFEILVNDVFFDYVLDNNLYSVPGQQAFTGAVAFPEGVEGQAAVGAIMVKAAWMILADPATQAARFHVSPALVYTPGSLDPKVEPTCTLQTVGLVGFHVGHKTQAAPQWIWSTFEHVDNVPTAAEVQSGKLQGSYNFYNPACKTCPVNEPPPRPWNPNQTTTPCQVVREDVLPSFATNSADTNNQTAQALLAGVNAKSVWTNYMLISTQWPTDPGDPAQPFGNPAPQFLANTTLETYIQGSVPNVSSSCIQCHGNATMTTGVASDFTYLLERAQAPSMKPAAPSSGGTR